LDLRFLLTAGQAKGNDGKRKCRATKHRELQDPPSMSNLTSRLYDFEKTIGKPAHANRVNIIITTLATGRQSADFMSA
jgi:hypothetical protein